MRRESKASSSKQRQLRQDMLSEKNQNRSNKPARKNTRVAVNKQTGTNKKSKQY